ncbi:unnamed protein product [Arabis nemorensis]|uniref:Uncharacterized protein n=1 Tax=Arabis nemorensis TaxID=586526 RepID=A0A565BUZ4_9BRAS|nr:unnamed protein product [Arabis nemorensis]
MIQNIYWADSGDRVAIVSNSSFKILKFSRDFVSSYLDCSKQIGEKGILGVFEILNETKERVQSGLWVRDIRELKPKILIKPISKCI